MYKILIIDDSDHVRGFLTDFLGEAGYEVIEASTGLGGLELLRSRRVNCVLLDVILPDIDGLEVLKRIRQKDNKLPVLMMTAEDPGWMKMHCESYGANGFLSKVFDTENILEAIENVILESET